MRHLVKMIYDHLCNFVIVYIGMRIYMYYIHVSYQKQVKKKYASTGMAVKKLFLYDFFVARFLF